MIPDQTTGISDRCIVKFQAAQDLSCQFLTCRAVSLEVVSAVPVRLFHDWFRNVVKKHCDAEKPVILNLCKTFQNMLAHSIAVVWGILLCLHAGIKFRKKFSCKPGFPCSTEIIRMIRYQKLHKLGLDTLCTDMFQIS